MSLMSHVFLGLGCVLDEGSPAYTQVSHVSYVSHVFRFRLRVGRGVSRIHPGVTCLLCLTCF